jgi:tetratricopeptide (TPR) repeat protein
MSLASGDLARGGPRLERALLILREVGDMEGIARAAGPLGHLSIVTRDFAKARPLIEEAGRLSAQIGDDWQASIYHSRLGAIALLEGNHESAADEFHAALVTAQLTDDALGTAVALYSLALNAINQGDLPEAHDYLADGLSAAYGKGDTNSPPLFIAALADLAARQGEPERAVRLNAAAESLRTPSGTTWLAAYVLPWPDDGPTAETLRRKLGGEVYDKARRQGGALGLDRATTEALAT